MESFGNNVCTYFTRSARLANCCRPHIFWNTSLCALVTFAIPADSRMSAKGSTWDGAWPSNTSDFGRRTNSAIFSRYSNYNLPDGLSLLRLDVAVLSGSFRLETPIPPQHLAAIGGFHLRGSSELSHRLRLDAEWERDGVRQVQPGGKSFAVGELTR